MVNYILHVVIIKLFDQNDGTAKPYLLPLHCACVLKNTLPCTHAQGVECHLNIGKGRHLHKNYGIIGKILKIIIRRIKSYSIVWWFKE